MEIRKQKPKRTQTPSDPPEQPVRRERVEVARRRAARLNDAIEKQAKKGNGDTFVQNRQQEIQQQLAQLRREAVQARRLAEQINNLSREATTQKRQPRMSHTPTVEQGPAQQLSRRASDKSRASGSQTRFNPLHPSLELPPEQLIRLLGLEDKPSRRKQRSRVADSAEAGAHGDNRPTALANDPVSELPLPRLEVPTDHRMYRKRQHRDRDTTPFPQKRSNLLLIATGIGVLAGIALSAYVFWRQPDAQLKPPGAPVKTTAAGATLISPAPVKRQSTAIAAPPPTTTMAATPAAVTAPTVNPPVTRQKTAPAPTGGSAPADDPGWRAAVEAQEQRLQAAAEQRLRARMAQHNSFAAEDPAVVSPSSRSAPAAIAPGDTEMLSPTDSDYRTDEASTPDIAPEVMPENLDERLTTSLEQEAVAPQHEPDDLPVTPATLSAQENPVITSEAAAAGEEIGELLIGADTSGSSVAPEVPIAESAPNPDGTHTEPGAIDGGQVVTDQGEAF